VSKTVCDSCGAIFLTRSIFLIVQSSPPALEVCDTQFIESVEDLRSQIDTLALPKIITELVKKGFASDSSPRSGPADPTQQSGKDGDLCRFVAFARMLLDVMPRPLATLFADRWDTRFPAYPWKNDAAAGSLLVDGISTKLEELGVLYATCDAKEVVPSPELWAKLAHDDLIWVNGEQFKIIGIARQPCRLHSKFPFADGGYSVKRAVGTQVFPTLVNRNGSKIGRHILDKLKTGDAESWDVTAFNTALLGSSIELLPNPPANVSPTSPREDKQKRHVNNIRLIKNVLLSHTPKASVDRATFSDAKKQMEECIAMCCDEDSSTKHGAELQAICLSPFTHSGVEEIVARVGELAAFERQCAVLTEKQAKYYKSLLNECKPGAPLLVQAPSGSGLQIFSTSTTLTWFCTGGAQLWPC
jgi:hypothetical protein